MGTKTTRSARTPRALAACGSTLALAIAGLACADLTGPPAGEAVASEPTACPLGVEGATITARDLPGGVEVTLRSMDRTDELRRRVRDVARSYGPDAHAGIGHDGQHRGAFRHGLKLWAAPSSVADVEDTDGGVMLRLVAEDQEQVEALRAHVRARVALLATVSCG